MKRPSLLILAAAIYSLQPISAYAEQALRPLWELGAGVALLSFPDYRGSDEQRQFALPIPYLVYRGKILQIDRQKVRGLLFKSGQTELDISVNGSIPVYSDKNQARAGMPNLDPTLEIGPQLNYLFFDSARQRLRLHVPLRSVVAVDHGHLHNVGWLVNPMLSLDIKNTGPDGGWNLGISGGPIWADARYHDYYYSVAPQYATAERPAYDGHGGYSGTHLTLTMSKRYSNIWVGAFLRANDVHGSAFEDSPLLKRRTGFMAGIGVSWVFAQSDRLTMADE